MLLFQINGKRHKMVKQGIAVVGIWSFVLLCLAWWASEWNIKGMIVYSSLPFVIATVTCCILSIAGILWECRRTMFFWILVPIHGVLIVLCFCFDSPSGDHGTLIRWGVGVGIGSLIATFISIYFGIRYFIERKKRVIC